MSEASEPASSPAIDPAGGTTGVSEWSGRRADARRNHEQVLAAAIEVFTEHGLGATIPQVAERAGVGKATVYRSYPTKADLVRAVAQFHADWLVQRFLTAADDAPADAYAALESALEDVFGRLAEDRLMVEVLTGVEGLEVDPEATAKFIGVLEQAQRQGTLRADATFLDLQVMMAGVGRAMMEFGIEDPDAWRRYARLAVAALRP